MMTEPAALTQTQTKQKSGGGGRRVLIVEDNVDSAESLCFLLEAYGYEVAIAYTGPEGVSRAKEFQPETVICDIGLPELDGFGVARALRNSPETARAQIIAVTGYGREEDKARGREAGFDHHLVKPVDPNTLLEKVGLSGA
jgi:CheY-like chemotaxis protein